MAFTTTLYTVLASCIAYSILSDRFTSFLIKKFTTVNELIQVHKPRPDGRKISGTVVIAGGGGGGLITASVLTKHFTKVVVIEPEEWVNTEEGLKYEKPPVHMVDGLRMPYRKRRRVPQFLSLHTWPSFVSATMRRLFPRWDQSIKDDHGIIEQYGSAPVYCGITIPNPDHIYPLGLPDMMFISRANFEPVLRRNVRTVYPEIEFITGLVVGINPDKLDKSKIASVSYKLNGDEQIRTLDAFLFLDCAGPINAGLKWLSDAGYGKLPSTSPSDKDKLPLDRLKHRYNQKMKASTSYWPITPMIRSGISEGMGMPWGGYPYLYFPCPGRDDRMLGIGRLEDDQILVLCSGWGEHVPCPRNLAEIREFIEGMNPFVPLPKWIFQFLDELKECEEDGVYDIYTLPPCSRVYYPKAANLPSNFIAIGDSSMAVNPVFGQGFSKVCMGTLIMDSMLCKIPHHITALPPNFAKDFFVEQEAKVNEPIWAQTKSQDYAWPTTIPVEGETLKEGAFMRWFGHHLILASIMDKHVAAIRYQVVSFVYPGICLFHPRVLFRVLQCWWSGKIPGV